jgi:thiamine pyrophosphate-dependent acetolactate synthase large subunit-like protein
MMAALPHDTIITNGAGNYASWAHRFWRYGGMRTQLAPTNGAMGYAVPAGVAAKIIDPKRTVVTFAGDGEFMMTGQELATAVQYGAGVIIVVFNNSMFGTIRMHQEKTYPGRVSGTTLHNPDFAALARAYGGHGEIVEKTADFACIGAGAGTRERQEPAGADRAALRRQPDYAECDAGGHAQGGGGGASRLRRSFNAAIKERAPGLTGHFPDEH